MSTTPTNPMPRPMSCWRGGSFPSISVATERSEERRRAVQHPGDSGRHVALGEREHRQRDRDPGDAQRARAAANRCGRSSDESREEPRACTNPNVMRNVVINDGAECVEPDRDEQERRAPDAACGAQQSPVERSERIGVRALGRREDAGRGPRRDGTGSDRRALASFGRVTRQGVQPNNSVSGVTEGT